MDRIIIKLKPIKYKEDFFYYLFFYPNLDFRPLVFKSYFLGYIFLNSIF